MTATLNRTQLIGNIGAEPKLITTKEGKVLVTASLATNEAVKRFDKWENTVIWHQLIFFGSISKVTDQLHKGSQVYIEGKLRSNTWMDAKGATRQTTSIVVSNVQLLGQSKQKSEELDETDSLNAETHLAQMREMLETGSDEIPF